MLEGVAQRPDIEPANCQLREAPAGRPGRVPRPLSRPRLVARLRTAGAGKVTVLRGPPGCGKSTLLADWMRVDSRPCLIPAGPDPTEVWADAVAALETHGTAAALVLDGVECLPDDPATDVVTALLALPGVRLVLSTRTAPALPLSRWRLAGELTEIEASDLAFTPAEAAEVCWRYGLSLSEVDAAALVARTDGWPALVCLAALARVDGRDDDDVRNDFLRTEVYDSQSPGARDLLVRISQIPAVRADLAEMLTGRPDSCRLLEQLRKDGLLLRESTAPEGPTRDWYRPLRPMQEFLRREAELTIAGELAGLRLTAARWHAEFGDAPTAVWLAMASGNHPYTARLVTRFAGQLLLGRDRAALSALRLPIVDASDEPEVAAALAVAAADRGDAHAAAAFVAMAAQSSSVLADRDAQIRVAVALAELVVARRTEPGPAWRDGATHLIHRLDGAVPGLISGADLLTALAWSSRGMAQLADGELGAAQRSLVTAAGCADQVGTGIVDEARAGLALLEAIRGQPARAVDLAQYHHLAKGVESEAPPLLARSGICGLGRAVLDWGHWQLGEALAVSSTVDAVVSGALVAATRARLLVAGGAAAGADEMLRPYLVDAAEPLPRLALEWLALAEADLHLSIGRPVHALTALSRVSHGRDDPLGGPARVMSARAYLDSAAPARAASLVAPVQERSDVGPLTRVGAWLVGALAADAQGHDGTVGIALAEALAVAAPVGIVAPFREAAVLTLLDRHRDLVAPYQALATRIASLPLPGRNGWRTVDDHGLHPVTLPPRNRRGDGHPAAVTEPITAREAVVLRYLPTLLTLNDIARELSVSPNTVKSHLRHIYGKLAVSSRRDAVRQARRLGLLWD